VRLVPRARRRRDRAVPARRRGRRVPTAGRVAPRARTRGVAALRTVAAVLGVIAVAFFAAAAGYLLRDSQDLTQEWAHCVDTAQGYDVEYPADWQVARGRFACSFFDPDPFTVPESSDFSGTALQVGTVQQSFDDAVAGLIDRRFARTEHREQVTIGGKRAFRLELVATGEGLEERGTRTYGYVIRRDDGPPVFLRTTAVAGEPLVHRAVVDRAATTLRTFPPAAPEAASPDDALLPAPVAEKRAALLAALRDGDPEAVAALADEPFQYSFGGPYPGGPAELWRDEAARGEDPLEVLEQILNMPYTLATGHYVWPFAYDKTADTLTDYERGLLEPLRTTFAGEGYLGWRAGFTPDGRWIFFVAGD
jgi:hypothetical protein